MQISNESIQEHTKSMTAHAMSRSVYGNIYIYIEREREMAQDGSSKNGFILLFLCSCWVLRGQGHHASKYVKSHGLGYVGSPMIPQWWRTGCWRCHLPVPTQPTHAASTHLHGPSVNEGGIWWSTAPAAMLLHGRRQTRTPSQVCHGSMKQWHQL